MADIDLAYEAERTLKRIRPKITDKIERVAPSPVECAKMGECIDERLAEHWPRLFRLLYRLYGQHYDFYYYLESILLTAIDCWLERPFELHNLDLRRENDPEWYLNERMVGGSLYVDLFNGDLNGLREKIPYLKDLGLTYLHLMPLFAVRPENNDGGYAISDYRSVDPRLGTMDDLRALAKDLKEVGISLVLDFVFNHTSDDHLWAIKAQEGDREYLNYYYTFDDRVVPDQYEKNLREIFPTIRRGNFTWHQGMKKWIWTTFNSFQWDLNYANPEVFRAMASEMLYLANTGVEILRLDAVAFIWKRMGTTCENLPEAHWLIQAFNAVCRIAAPSLVFKSEAIVHPDEVVKYIGSEECQISYNPALMAIMWEAIATRETKLLQQSLSHRQELIDGSVWVNYLRCHDDIGWAFDNGDAWKAGINPDDHRDFLNRFYTGRFTGSFAEGIPFQHNEDTGDMRICGTMGSLVGLEQAIERGDSVLVDMAVRRIKMLYGILASIGGIPLMFYGEEFAVLNDYTYESDPAKVDDSRWVHRPQMDWGLLKELKKKNSIPATVFRILQNIFDLRKQYPALGGTQLELLDLKNDHLLGYRRWKDASQLVVFANFSEREQIIDLEILRSQGLGHFVRDVLTHKVYSTRGELTLKAFDIYWMVVD